MDQESNSLNTNIDNNMSKIVDEITKSLSKILKPVITDNEEIYFYLSQLNFVKKLENRVQLLENEKKQHLDLIKILENTVEKKKNISFIKK